MIFEWDENKNRKNLLERGLSFEKVKDMAFHSAIFQEDTRKDYGEKRVVVYGLIEERLHILCFTPVKDGIRVISFRKANAREVTYYEKAKQASDQ